jgi:acetyltransferase-like isoleucine patch superfamily enzyme
MLNKGYLSREELLRCGFASVGDDVLVHPSCVLVGCERMTLGSHVRIDPYCIVTIGSRLEIGSYVHISGHAAIVGAGAITIGDFAAVSHGARIFSSSDDFTAGGIFGPQVPMAYRSVTSAPVVIGRHAVVGANSVVLPGGCIGEGAAIGAVSLVKGAVSPWTVHAGVPTRPLAPRDREAVLAQERAFLAGRLTGMPSPTDP